MFIIKNGDDLSLEEIRKAQESGASVLRSAHVGNFNPPTLFLAQEKFPIILHEHIRGDAKIYRPAFVKIGGQEIPLSEQIGLPLTHEFLNNQLDPKVSQLVAGPEGVILKRPAQIHYQTLRKLFPGNVQLTSDLFLGQDLFFQKALGVLAKEFPQLFANFVDRKGNVFNLEERAPNGQLYKDQKGETIFVGYDQIAEQTYQYLLETVGAIAGDGRNPEGLVMKSNLYVLLSSLCEIYRGRSGQERYRSGQVEVFHFSGAEMINYLIKNRKQAKPNEVELNAMFASVREALPNLLPEEVVFKLIPTDMLGRLVSSEKGTVVKIESLFSEHQSLVDLYSSRQQTRGESSGEIGSRILSLGDEGIKTEIERLRKDFDRLPGKFKKRLVEAEGMTGDMTTNRRKITGILVSILIGTRELASGNADEERLAEARGKILELSTQIREASQSEISQYDMAESGKRVYFPEAAFSLGQSRIREVWNYSMNESGKEIGGELRRK